MIRKIFRTGNSTVISLPKSTLDYLGLTEGSEVHLELDREGHQIVIAPVKMHLPGVDEAFASQVADFIEIYRPALEALAK